MLDDIKKAKKINSPTVKQLEATDVNADLEK